jgi:hypothetical protein
MRVSLNRIASKQSPPTPAAGCQLAAISQPSICGICCGSKRLGEIASLGRLAETPRAPGGDLLAQRRDQMRVVPRLLHEVAHAAAHRLNRQVDAAPTGHDDHRQQPVELLHARQQIDALTPRRRVAGVVEVHQHGVECARPQRRDRRVGRGDGVELEAVPLEQQREGVEQVPLIVGNQDARGRVGVDGNEHVGGGIFQSACHRSV